ncbi:CPBP family intramembrane metalloprotease [Streptomonospora sp. S1-112]|uniref:CPBP family intramembrane metalloprotease n=1 Tax=Streptomonospora mangrovi TaxID=2883123 RepID=A0A9X3SQA8_9ACTN|nr:type II CAAX endopeptidase family protein [Streptomonospora mangrovi]MDA0566486.1 CPBP family intramembrane metalloprotease [Streptomonospora mangrovi]
MRLVWQLLAVAAVGIIGSQVAMAFEGNAWATLVVGLLASALTLLAYWWVVRLTERRTVTEVVGKGSVRGLLIGTVAGFALFAMVIVNIFFLGHYQVNGLGTVLGAIGLFGFMAAAAVTEEVLFRGVLFRIMEGWWGTWIALVVPSLLFALAHVPNPGATVVGIGAVFIAGTMFSAAYAATRSLWLPIGLHFGWNYAASAVFSTEVSGAGTPTGLLDTTITGPAMLTGGSFGPEASPYSIAFCLLTTLVFLWLAHRRGRLVPLRKDAKRVESGSTLPQ